MGVLCFIAIGARVAGGCLPVILLRLAVLAVTTTLAALTAARGRAARRA